MNAPQPALITALLEPGRCPPPVQRVDLVETHGAWVLLAGDRAWKIKKPVCLPFMDFSTLALRRAACQAEVRLNRRFETDDPATHLYLDALPIVGPAHDPRWGRPGDRRRRCHRMGGAHAPLSTKTCGWTTCASAAP